MSSTYELSAGHDTIQPGGGPASIVVPYDWAGAVVDLAHGTAVHGDDTTAFSGIHELASPVRATVVGDDQADQIVASSPGSTISAGGGDATASREDSDAGSSWAASPGGRRAFTRRPE